LLGQDDAVLAGIARLAGAGAEVTPLVSVLPRDNLPAVPRVDALADAYGRHGLGLVEAREATRAEVAASCSSWAKRLRAGAERPVTLLRARATELRGASPTRLVRSGRDRRPLAPR
jgi:16S rRNA (adenine(1408)-N(1))-methyltransferase